MSLSQDRHQRLKVQSGPGRILTVAVTTLSLASPTTANPGSDFGFIRSWTAKAGTFYLRFDRAVLLTGKAADDASAAHGGESSTTTTSRTTTHACARS